MGGGLAFALTFFRGRLDCADGTNAGVAGRQRREVMSGIVMSRTDGVCRMIFFGEKVAWGFGGMGDYCYLCTAITNTGVLPTSIK